MNRIRTTLMAVVLCAGAGSAVAADQGVTRYVRFQIGELTAYGIVEGPQVRQLAGDLFGRWEKTDTLHALDEVKLLVPAPANCKVLALAGNYRSHLGAQPTHRYPEVFFKVPSALLPHGENVVIPKGTGEVHFEAELVIVIGRRARDVAEDRALAYVLGVTAGNDISARDWQKNDVQWWRAKGSDTFAPCGPMIVSGVDYDDLLLVLRQNGQVRQKARTSEMVHNVAQIVSWISRHVTLEPGDLIYTGTPGTTAAIQPGDTLEVELEGAGVLRNGVEAAK
jgi:2-keto-4-pentenoate hydratase/2-oxohepta-3-ene-1,7-dioic acid hydratase in catechol pathway